MKTRDDLQAVRVKLVIDCVGESPQQDSAKVAVNNGPGLWKLPQHPDDAVEGLSELATKTGALPFIPVDCTDDVSRGLGAKLEATPHPCLGSRARTSSQLRGGSGEG